MTRLLGALLCAFLLLPGPAAAKKRERVPERTVRYLERSQNGDGGFGDARGQPSAQLFTGWAALGLAAAGENPTKVRRNGRSPVSYILGRPGEIDDIGSIERSVLVLVAAGKRPTLGGRDLAAEVLGRQGADGSFDGYVSYTSFGILALRAAGRPVTDPAVSRAATWVAAQQNDDGGFSVAKRGSPSDVDNTGAAVQALAAAGLRGSPTVDRAVAYLAGMQTPAGGFPLAPGGQPNAQSTAYAVQALLAAGREPEDVRAGGRSPVAFIRTLIDEDGSVRYSRTSDQTPVWVTAQAITALARKPFPLRAVRRRWIGAGEAATCRRCNAGRSPVAFPPRPPGPAS